MNKSICEKIECTACGVCELACPKECITKHINPDASWYLTLNTDECVECGLCGKVCPNLNIPMLNYPTKAYAAWCTNEQEHKTSASGGIAVTLYRYAISSGMYIAGVGLDEKFEAHYYLTNKVDDIKKFKNSKYTYSYLDDTPIKIKECLKKGIDVLFIGLPCQVASVKNFVSLSRGSGNLYTIDLVCHGTPPPQYLHEHIKAVEKINEKESKMIFFRDPAYSTDKFAFTMYGESIFDQTNLLLKNHKPFYKKYVDQDDLYQIGYHRALIYRDCCYQCHYAKRERVGDLTLGDYHGLGQASPYYKNYDQVSCVLVNTEKGNDFWNRIIVTGNIESYERPVQEPLEHEKQLNAPSVAPAQRKKFIEFYEKNHDYEVAASVAFESYVKLNRRQQMFPIKKIKSTLTKMIPRSIKELAKIIVRKAKLR